MKLASTLLATTLFAALFLTACGEKPAEPAAEATPAAETTAAPEAEAAPAAQEPGGYVPTAEERVPGITLPADAAPAEAAPAEEAPATEEGS